MHGERSFKSILQVYALLQRISHSPMDYAGDREWLGVLATQFSLAEYSNKELGIRGCAMGTFRRSATKALSIGFKGLDELRRNAHAKLLATYAQPKPQRPKGRRQYQSEIADLKLRLDKVSKDFMQMQIIFHKFRYIAEQLATDDHIRDRKVWWLREMREIEIIFSGVTS